MKKRLFIYTILILLAGFSSFFAASVFIAHRNNMNIAGAAVVEATRLHAGLFHDDVDLARFVGSGNGDTRITIISAGGRVLADSHARETDENYLDRPEIVAARTGFPAIYVRYSDTLGTNLIYYAVIAGYGLGYVYIRAAMPVERINVYLNQSLPLFFVIFFGIAAAAFSMIHVLANQIFQPLQYVQERLRKLSNDEPLQYSSGQKYDEINIISREIDEVSLLLQDKFQTLQSERNKLDYILGSIGDGLFAVDDKGCISLINAAACTIFGIKADITGKKLNFLTNEQALIEAVESSANQEKDSMFELPLGGKIYFVTTKKLPDSNATITILSDITQIRENGKRREEFFANASHELKTPLTAIRGFSELATINNKDDEINKFLAGITRETARMTELIADMLRLSEIESAAQAPPPAEPVSLAQIINEVQESMLPAIMKKSILFKTSGGGEVVAATEHVYEVIKNLVENAVKYSTFEGKISVKLRKEKAGTLRLTVSDTGIGISPDDQTKIFERFYRVDKSRSNQNGNGGTGLGLSIVKHICALYGWDLSLKSKLGVGTDVTIDF